MKAISALLIGVAAALMLELSFGILTGFPDRIPPAAILFAILCVAWVVVGRILRPR